mmetsp:Transcript_41690/g.131569  ORF Transcript_41690/g.131569 Transcript_41690/m.131569 type:complete len:206 (+) Transcript_41690:511-1128(+)
MELDGVLQGGEADPRARLCTDLLGPDPLPEGHRPKGGREDRRGPRHRTPRAARADTKLCPRGRPRRALLGARDRRRHRRGVDRARRHEPRRRRGARTAQREAKGGRALRRGFQASHSEGRGDADRRGGAGGAADGAARRGRTRRRGLLRRRGGPLWLVPARQGEQRRRRRAHHAPGWRPLVRPAAARLRRALRRGARDAPLARPL